MWPRKLAAAAAESVADYAETKRPTRCRPQDGSTRKDGKSNKKTHPRRPNDRLLRNFNECLHSAKCEELAGVSRSYHSLRSFMELADECFAKETGGRRLEYRQVLPERSEKMSQAFQLPPLF